MKSRAGESVGGYTLLAPIGAGGNADVWLGVSGSSRVAVKIPRSQNPKREPFRRFCSEVDLLLRLRGKAGVLPVLEANVDPSEGLVHHCTPVAETFEQWLKVERTLDQIVSAIADVADTLAELAVDGVHHRDLKPTNIFLLEGEWLLGDWGLATYPDKAALTQEHKRLGPVYYIAPEMLNHPTESDAGPADVYSLAKTAWVAATGQNYPIQGEHNLTEASVRIGTFVVHEGTHSLDRVLARATSYNPSARPSMRDFAAELREWATPRASQAPIDERHAGALRGEFHSLAASVAERGRAHDQLAAEMQEEARDLANWLDPLEADLAEILPYKIHRGSGRGTEKNRPSHRRAVAGPYADHAVYLDIPVRDGQNIAVRVHLYVQPTEEAVQEVRLQGLLRSDGEDLVPLAFQGEFPSGSPLRARVRRQFEAAMADGLPLLLHELRRLMEAAASS